METSTSTDNPEKKLEIEKQKGADMSGEIQHGFKKNRSTTTAALALQNIIAKAMDEDHYVAVASMDLTAAFDVLNVDLLLTRLKIMGIPNDVIQLITAWLKDRVAYVEVGSTCSEYYAVDFGSGQGSILGPVLFNYYVAPLVIEKKILTYADDNYQVVSNKCKKCGGERTGRTDDRSRALDVRLWTESKYRKDRDCGVP